jgi:hypothetical protein
MHEGNLKRAVQNVADTRLRGLDRLVLRDTPTDSEINYASLRRYVDLAIDRVKGDKTPGFPLNLTYANNYMALEAEREEIALTAVARLHLWLTNEVVGPVGENPMAYALLGMCDPSSVFIKKEPHPSRKFQKKQFRSINPVSLPDQIVESVLFTEPAKRLREGLFYNGSAVGISFTDKGNKEFCDFLINAEKRFGSVISDDISGFDARHNVQILEATAYLDQITFSSPDGLEHWNCANRNWVRFTANSLAVIDGTVYGKVTPGMINSGSKDTSRRNTALRCIYTHYFALCSGQEATHVTANGDDGLAWGIDDEKSYFRAAEEHGVPLRDLHRGMKDLPFCSHQYDPERAIATLSSWPKFTYAIISQSSKTRDDAEQALCEARYNAEYSSLCAAVKAMKFPDDDEFGQGEELLMDVEPTHFDLEDPFGFGQGGFDLPYDSDLDLDEPFGM